MTGRMGLDGSELCEGDYRDYVRRIDSAPSSGRGEVIQVRQWAILAGSLGVALLIGVLWARGER